MIKYEEYFISNQYGKSNCVVRTMCKIFNKDYDTVFNELVALAKELNQNSFNDIEVFEEYLKRNNFEKIKYGKNLKVKDLELDNNTYVVFCYDKKDWYHIVPIIDNVLYDKNDKALDLYIITIYKNMAK